MRRRPGRRIRARPLPLRANPKRRGVAQTSKHIRHQVYLVDTWGARVTAVPRANHPRGWDAKPRSSRMDREEAGLPPIRRFDLVMDDSRLGPWIWLDRPNQNPRRAPCFISCAVAPRMKRVSP